MLFQSVHLKFVLDAETWRSRLVGDQIYLLDFIHNCQLVWDVDKKHKIIPAEV